MRDATVKVTRSPRPLILFTVGTALYWLTFVLALYELDRQHFTGAKQQIIRDHFHEIFGLPTDQLRLQAGNALFGPTAKSRQAALRDLEEHERRIVNGATSVFRFVLRDPEGTVISQVEAPDKPAKVNTWQNSLILRNFTSKTDLVLNNPNRPNTESRRVAYLVADYATPVGQQQIDELAQRYRMYALGMTILWAGIYYFLYKYVLRPMQTVTARLEEARFLRPALIRRPTGLLETSYNHMAVQALLLQLEDQLNTLLRPGMNSDRGKITTEALDFLRGTFGLEKVVVSEVSNDLDRLTVLETFTAPLDLSVKDSDVIAKAQFLVSPGRENEEGFWAEPDQEFAYWGPAGPTTLFAYGNPVRGMTDWKQRLDSVRRAMEILRRSFLTYHAYRQDIMKQRTEANIVLSRNLGHDLTNIIATTKLDLMAVKQVVDQPKLDLSAQRAEMLRQSVRGLLESTKFLQEIVNVYRSFSHVKRPQYERYDLNGLVEEFLRSFEPSVSSRISIRREMAEGLPAPILEPRLLKLALFNVISNALDAMKRMPKTNGQSQSVVVRTNYDLDDGGVFQIIIEDTGPGIRDAEGRLLAPQEISTIFQYGYSTKVESSEGLGLSWVRTIMVDFHNGGVHAENLKGGGARFTLSLRSMESAEAKVQESPVGRSDNEAKNGERFDK